MVAQVFLENIFELHGMLQFIVTDCDLTFNSNFYNLQ